MMRIVFVLVTASIVSAWGQPALTPSKPALIPSSPPVPSSPALSAPATAASTNLASNGTNLTVADLSARLVAMQAALEEALPLVAAFNDSFGFVSAGAVTPGTGANFGVNFGSNMAANFGSNLGANLATPVAPTVGAPTNSVTGTLRAMLILEDDIERTLPLLNALNGGNNTNISSAGLPAGFAPASLTNALQSPPANQ